VNNKDTSVEIVKVLLEREAKLLATKALVSSMDDQGDDYGARFYQTPLKIATHFSYPGVPDISCARPVLVIRI